MAFELIYKNIGGISCKADVYSFGMLLMEIAGRKQNLNVIQHSWQTSYHAKLVYDQFDEIIHKINANDEEKMLVEKMMNVAFQCIHMNPNDRPSMDVVIEMLEGDAESQEFIRPEPSPTRQEIQTSCWLQWQSKFSVRYLWIFQQYGL